MLFAGFAVADRVSSHAHHHLTLLGIVAAGLLGTHGWLVGRLRGRPRRTPGAVRTSRRKGPHGSRADRAGRPLVPALRRAGRAVRAHDPARARLRLAACGRRAHAVLRFTLFTLIGSLPWVLVLALAGEALGSDWDSSARTSSTSTTRSSSLIVIAIGALIVRRRQGRASRRAARRSSDRPRAVRRRRSGGGSATPRTSRSAMRSRWDSCRDRPSCCRSPHRRTQPDPTARGLALWRARPRAAQGVRGGAARGAGLALAVDLRGELVGGVLARAATRGRRSSPSRSHRRRCSPGDLDRPIERRLGGPRSIAAGLVARIARDGSRRAAPGARTPRRSADAGALDGLALGLAQAPALIPGVSRSGATLTAARVRGFSRGEAQALSWRAALPVILGAGALTGARLARDGLRGAGAALARARSRPSYRRSLCGTLRGGSRGARCWPPRSTAACLRLTWCAGRERRTWGDDRTRDTSCRPLPARRRDRTRRHVDRLRRLRRRARTAGGDQADAPRDRLRLDQLERFRREARSVAQLSHPHIVTVIDAGEEPRRTCEESSAGTPYIVFEYVEGETLKQLIRREGPLEITEAIAYAIEIARALGAAHERLIVHRDVKPQNVLVGAEGGAKITDFGIARTLSEEGLTAGRASARHDRLRRPRSRRSASPSRASRTSTRWASSCSRCSPETFPFTANRRSWWR